MRNVLPSGGAEVVGGVWEAVVPVDCCGMCWVCWLSVDWVLWLPVSAELVSTGTSGIGIGGRFSRSDGMSGGATGG